MRIPVCLLALAALAIAGCARRHEAPVNFTPVNADQTQATDSRTGKPVVTPDTSLVGSVARVNAEGRFVIVTFPLSRVPQADTRMYVYRDGLKVGEVKFTNWRRENNLVADLINGEAHVGDEVRN